MLMCVCVGVCGYLFDLNGRLWQGAPNIETLKEKLSDFDIVRLGDAMYKYLFVKKQNLRFYTDLISDIISIF